jgi:hypothetical protein
MQIPSMPTNFHLPSFTLVLSVLALLLVCLTGMAQADIVTSFLTNGDFSTGVITPWANQGATVNDGDGNANPPSCLLAGGSDPNAVGYISQPAKVNGANYTPVVGDVFTIDFDSANVGYDVNATAHLLPTLMYNDGSWHTELTFPVDMLGAATPVWEHHTFTYTVTDGSPMLSAIREAFSLENVAVEGGAPSRVDNISFTLTQVPEPGTVMLLTTGLLGLLAYAWRKRK